THGHVRDIESAVAIPREAVADLGLNLLVAFGLPFFLGPLEGRGGEEPIPNFPPGGVFQPRVPTRFGITDRHVPLYLRTMNGTGDKEWVAKAYREEHGHELSPDELEEVFRQWLSRGEADLLLLIECDNRYLTVDFWDGIYRRVVQPHGLQVKSLQEGFTRGDGRDHTGYLAGISNMRARKQNDPAGYRSKIFLPHPAPAYPGEPDWSRDDPRYDDGTYLVHRKYRENLDRWFSNDFTVTDHYGHTFKGAVARQ